MPFIRYDTTDDGYITDEACSCGRGYKMLKEVKGRSIDILLTPEGKHVHGWFFLYIFWEQKGIKEYQVVQETLEQIVIKIVPDEHFEERQLDEIRQIVSSAAKAGTWSSGSSTTSSGPAQGSTSSSKTITSTALPESIFSTGHCRFRLLFQAFLYIWLPNDSLYGQPDSPTSDRTSRHFHRCSSHFLRRADHLRQRPDFQCPGAPDQHRAMSRHRQRCRRQGPDESSSPVPEPTTHATPPA